MKAGWAWQQAEAPWTKLASQTSCISELSVQLRDLASMNKVKSYWGRHLMSAMSFHMDTHICILTHTTQSCIYVNTCIYAHTSHTHEKKLKEFSYIHENLKKISVSLLRNIILNVRSQELLDSKKERKASKRQFAFSSS